MPEGDDRGRKPQADTPGACGNVDGHHERIAEQLAPPDAEVMLREPKGLEACFVAELRQLAHLGDHVAVIAALRGVVNIRKVAEFHGSGPPRLVYHNTTWPHTVQVPLAG